MSYSAGLPGAYGANDGVGTNAQFTSPTGVAADGASNIYVADFYNNTIRKISPAAVISTFAGFSGASSTNDGLGTGARFRNLPSRPVEPLAVRRQSNDLDGGEPFWRVRRRVTERLQLAGGHQNLNVMLREPKQFRRGCPIKAGR